MQHRDDKVTAFLELERVMRGSLRFSQCRMQRDCAPKNHRREFIRASEPALWRK
jgi:hypothetical protein